eukprot:Hpha_TRINITY_DN5363_c0_g1::TRINITY_DN5363_c0_g1_i1::g.32889::m.32889
MVQEGSGATVGVRFQEGLRELLYSLLPDPEKAALSAQEAVVSLLERLRSAVTEAPGADVPPLPPPWKQVPDGWGAASWEATVRALSADPNTFLVRCPNLPDLVPVLSAQGFDLTPFVHGPGQLSADWVTVACGALAADREMERVRFDLVPRWVDEEVFWENYLWKLSLMWCCGSVGAARAVLCVVNADPETAFRPRRKGRGVPEWTPDWVVQRTQSAAELEQRERSGQKITAAAAAEVGEAREAARLLHEVLTRGGTQRGDLDVLQRSYTRCRDMKNKLAWRMAAVESDTLSVFAVPLVPQLLEANAQLRSALSLCHRAGLASSEHGPIICLSQLGPLKRSIRGRGEGKAVVAAGGEQESGVAASPNNQSESFSVTFSPRMSDQEWVYEEEEEEEG